MNNSTIVNAEKSTHVVEVVPFHMEKHPNADSLSVVSVDDYKVVVNTQQWEGATKAAYVPPDSLVDVQRPEFNFLVAEAKYMPDCTKDKNGNYALIRAKKLRGIVSYGMLVPIDEAAFNIGDNVTEHLGIIHYDAPETSESGKNSGGTSAPPAKGPEGVYPKYDVDAFLKYGRKLFVTNEDIVITEKIDGENSRFVFKNGQQYVGSRTLWKHEYTLPPQLNLEDLITKIGWEARAKEIYAARVTNFKPVMDKWWQLFHKYEGLKEFCKTHEGWCVYGENYGGVGGMNYGHTNGERSLVVFDIRKPDGTWLNFDELQWTCSEYDLHMVPVLYEGPFDFESCQKYAEGNTTLGQAHLREGCVISPLKERWDDRLGRVKLKIHNPEWLEKRKA